MHVGDAAQRVVVIGSRSCWLLAGLYSFHELDIEAYPDPVQPMVEIFTLPSGLGAEEVEKIVTVPTRIRLAGMRSLTAMDSISLFGLSDVRLYFDWDSDYDWDRVETINQLAVRHACRRASRPGSRRRIRSAKSIATRSRAPITT